MGLARHLHDGGRRATEFSADEDAVAGPGAGAQHRLAFGRGADHDDVGEDSVGRFRGVAAGESDAEFLRQTDQAAGEASDPGLGQIARQGQGKEGRDRFSAHGGDVAQSARQAAVADRFRRMPVAAEVDAFQREVGRDQGFSSRQQAQHGAVVSNSGEDRHGSSRRSAPIGSEDARQTANLGNQRFFGKRHGATTIPPTP